MDEGLVGHAGDKCSNDVGIYDVGELTALFGELADVLSKGFTCFLFVGLEVPGVSRAHVSASEVPQRCI